MAKGIRKVHISNHPRFALCGHDVYSGKIMYGHDNIEQLKKHIDEYGMDNLEDFYCKDCLSHITFK